MTSQDNLEEISAKQAMSSLKRDPTGMFDLGSDGVLRSFSGPYKHEVIDAIRLSPRQIKGLLDMQPWPQEIENKFRGVDGRRVVSLFEPLPEDRKEVDMDESWRGKQNRSEEMSRGLRVRMEKDERDGIDVEEKYGCACSGEE